MAGQKRGELLTETERERLITRRDMKDSKKRIANDARAKKKLSAWSDNLDDVELILRNLPEEMSGSAIEEIKIYQLLNIISDLLRIKKFRRVAGDVTKLNSWQTAPSRPAENLDIARTAILSLFLDGFSRHIGADNPCLRAMGWLKVYVDPILRGRLTDEESQSVEKCIDAVEDIYGIDLNEVLGNPPT